MTRWLLIPCLWAITLAHAASPPPPPSDDVTVVPFTIIDNGVQSGIHPDTQQLVVIHNADDWQAFWAKHNTVSPPPPLPKVDFTKNMVITLIDTDQPNSGYALSLDKIEQHGHELWVYATRDQPAPTCMNLGMVAQPFVFVTLPKTTGKPKLIFSTQMYDC